MRYRGLCEGAFGIFPFFVSKCHGSAVEQFSTEKHLFDSLESKRLIVHTWLFSQ